MTAPLNSAFDGKLSFQKLSSASVTQQLSATFICHFQEVKDISIDIIRERKLNLFGYFRISSSSIFQASHLVKERLVIRKKNFFFDIILRFCQSHKYAH